MFVPDTNSVHITLIHEKTSGMILPFFPTSKEEYSRQSHDTSGFL